MSDIDIPKPDPIQPGENAAVPPPSLIEQALATLKKHEQILSDIKASLQNIDQKTP